MLRRPTTLVPSNFPVPHCTPVPDFASVEPLTALCAAGRLYEVEAWISEERPIQCVPPSDRKLQRRETPLLAAVSRGFHSLAALLLANGYNPDGDCHECLSPAVRARDRGMVDVLLRFGADPSSCDFAEVLESYHRPIMDQFVAAGVDPCANNAVAKALRHPARPVLGFVKAHRERFPCLQHQIDIALHGFVDGKNERGVALMLWLGGDPYAMAPGEAYTEDAGDSSHCAMESALWSDRAAICRMLLRRPTPAGRIDCVLRAASDGCSPEMVRRLLAMGADPNIRGDDGRPVLQSFVTKLVWRVGWGEPDQDACGLESLELMLAGGAKMDLPPTEMRRVRRRLRGGVPTTVARAVELLGKYGGIPADQLREMTRTPGMKRVLVGTRLGDRHPIYKKGIRKHVS